MPIPVDVQQADDEARLVYLAERVEQLAAELRLAGLVLIAYSGGDGPSITFRWPDCAPECDDPDACAVRVYGGASADLHNLVDRIRSESTGEGRFEADSADRGKP